jgi:hypothetical protein
VRGNLVTWHSKKQLVVARSGAEAELGTMAHRVCETLWLKILLKERRYDFDDSIRLYFDNKAAINIVYNPIQHG